MRSRKSSDPCDCLLPMTQPFPWLCATHPTHPWMRNNGGGADVHGLELSAKPARQWEWRPGSAGVRIVESADATRTAAPRIHEPGPHAHTPPHMNSHRCEPWGPDTSSSKAPEFSRQAFARRAFLRRRPFHAHDEPPFFFSGLVPCTAHVTRAQELTIGRLKRDSLLSRYYLLPRNGMIFPGSPSS